MRIIITLLCLLTFNTLLKSQPGSDSSIVFDATVFDFGAIEKGSVAEHDFVFKNQGQNPVTIINVRATCGCTVTKWTLDPVKPGESGLVKVKYNTSIEGQFTKSVIVIKSNNYKTYTLFIKGEVKRRK